MNIYNNTNNKNNNFLVIKIEKTKKTNFFAGQLISLQSDAKLLK